MSVSQMNVSQNGGLQRGPRRKAEDQLQPRGRFVVEHFRKGVKIGQYEFPNGITNEGKNKLLDVMFHGVSAITTWWLGLIDNSGYTALAARDTYANINQAGNGWDEFTDYTDAGQRRQRQHPARVDRRRGLQPGHHQRQPGGLRHHRQRHRQGPVPGGRHRQRPEQGRPRRPAASSGPRPCSAPATWPVNADDQLKVTYTVSA